MAEMSRRLIEAGLGWRYTPQRMAALIGDRETVALVAHDASRLQGFAVMQFGDAQAHLVLLCVEPSQRQRGIGRRLTEWLLDALRRYRSGSSFAGATSPSARAPSRRFLSWCLTSSL